MYGPAVTHQSDSTAQRDAEPLILSGVEARSGVKLAPRSLVLEGGARVDIDGVDDDESVFVEIFAHQGPLKGGQFHKVARDALKLITLARSRPNARLVIAFCDAEAAAGVSGRSWLSEALKAWGIEVVTVDVGDRAKSRLRAAQARQVMVNPSVSQVPFDALLVEALPLAAALLEEHAGAHSFLESYLEAALIGAIAEVAPAVTAKATGRKRIQIPNWDRKLGGFDLRVRQDGGAGAEAVIETKVDDVEHTLWDLFKLTAGLSMPGVEAGYLILARPAHRWQAGECSALFEEREQPKRWSSVAMLEEWKEAWAELTGERGGSARPTSIPNEVETVFLGRARAKGFDQHEIRCVAVRLPTGVEPLAVKDGWPVHM